MSVLSRVELAFLLCLEHLQLEEEVLKLVIKRHIIDVDRQKHFDGFETLGKLAHRTVVNWVSLQLNVLLAQDGSVPVDKIGGVLLENILNTDIELFMSFHCVCIVEDSGHEMAVLNVHILKPVLLLFLMKLVKQYFFVAYALHV
jgi:hypothetical protein